MFNLRWILHSNFKMNHKNSNSKHENAGDSFQLLYTMRTYETLPFNFLYARAQIFW